MLENYKTRAKRKRQTDCNSRHDFSIVYSTIFNCVDTKLIKQEKRFGKTSNLFSADRNCLKVAKRQRKTVLRIALSKGCKNSISLAPHFSIALAACEKGMLLCALPWEQ